MLLAIDVGNTNTMFAVVDDGEIVHRWRISTQASRTSDEYMVWLTQLMEIDGVDRHKVHRVVISTVVPTTLFNLERMARRGFGIDPLVVTKDLDLGVGIEVAHPEQVGMDRLVNCVAVGDRHEGDFIIIDFGTATTFDIFVGNAYTGGIIAPGINLSAEALYVAAAQLPRVAVAPPKGGKAKGYDTVSAMQSGIFFGYLAMIEGLVARLKAEAAGPMKVLATGGLAVLFEPYTSVIDVVDVDLTVRGLTIIDERNRR
ncbi:type III pantothenate kinase [Sphingosinicella sp.]|uniref:type III pantothenate kinase n=1 Tax=Sphingosinicella sp. TaxID=1917971 RepID=UPI0017F01BC4|nr:type III pantothenate kinase [Sphingosinicella sp.]MBA4757211.1 type III pantothenate kinase [Sphingosinicella sp.]